MTKPKTNPWDNADALLMAIRLRKQGIIYPDVEQVLGLVLIEIVKVATAGLIKNPKFRPHKELFFEQDTQSLVLLHVLEKLETIDCTITSRKAVNFIIKSAQNSLKNFIRYKNFKKRKGTLLSLEEANNVLPMCSDFFGQTRRHYDDGKVNTQELNH